MQIHNPCHRKQIPPQKFKLRSVEVQIARTNPLKQQQKPIQRTKNKVKNITCNSQNRKLPKTNPTTKITNIPTRRDSFGFVEHTQEKQNRNDL